MSKKEQPDVPVPTEEDREAAQAGMTLLRPDAPVCHCGFSECWYCTDLATLAVSYAHHRLRAVEQERERCARIICERCRTTPHLPAHECDDHPEIGGMCHDSGIDGWGHYHCAASAIREGK